MVIAHRDVAGLLRLHGYTEIKKVGEGSFGKAVLVTNEEGHKLICKMVDLSQASPKETRDAEKEAKLLANFKHPYVVRYRDSFLESGWLCILMDFCENGDLTKQIETAKRKGQRIPEEQILKWITQGLLALKYIHEKHVLHRDLKSGNFFISRSGNLKMGDFGIAKVLSCTLACAKTQIGTPYYLSPEVCQERPYAWSSDIWAMGCILYELCALKVPFDAPNISGLVQKICRGPTPMIPAGYSDFLKQLVQEMLNKSPNQRPSAEAILARPQIQSTVKQMLEQAQAAQENGNAGLTAEGMAKQKSEAVNRAPSVRQQQPEEPHPGNHTFRKGDLVEYWSNTHKDWLPASIINVDDSGRVIIDLKPNTWITLEQQQSSLRPRSGGAAALQGVGRRSPSLAPPPPPSGLPQVNRSPSVPGMYRAPSPKGPGSRCSTPGGYRRGPGQPSPVPSRCGTPSGGPNSRQPSPRNNGVAARGANAVPGLPRVPSQRGHSPPLGIGGPAKGGRPMRAAGMAIAGSVV